MWLQEHYRRAFRAVLGHKESCGCDQWNSTRVGLAATLRLILRQIVGFWRVVLTFGVVLGACDVGAQADPVEVEIATSTGSVDYDPSELTVPARAEVTIRFNNEDVFSEHDLLIVSDVFQSKDDARSAAAADADSDIVIGRSIMANPGDSDTLVVSFDSPGRYQFFCTVGLESTATSHFEAGMQGTIIVEG